MFIQKVLKHCIGQFKNLQTDTVARFYYGAICSMQLVSNSLTYELLL